jgi:RAB protein geranylgeranyltransferase component A
VKKRLLPNPNQASSEKIVSPKNDFQKESRCVKKRIKRIAQKSIEIKGHDRPHRSESDVADPTGSFG